MLAYCKLIRFDWMRCVGDEGEGAIGEFRFSELNCWPAMDKRDGLADDGTIGSEYPCITPI